jgi:hypothetical protein
LAQGLAFTARADRDETIHRDHLIEAETQVELDPIDLIPHFGPGHAPQGREVRPVHTPQRAQRLQFGNLQPGGTGHQPVKDSAQQGCGEAAEGIG